MYCRFLLRTAKSPCCLKSRKYADFRSDYEKGLNELLTGIKPPNIEQSGESETADYHSDYAFEWGNFHDRYFCRLKLFSHSHKIQYGISCEVTIIASEKLSQRFSQYYEAGFNWFANLMIFSNVEQLFEQIDPVIYIAGDEVAVQHFKVADPKGRGIQIDVSARRLGKDPGDDLLFNWRTTFEHAALQHKMGIEAALSDQEKANFAKWISKEHPGK